MMLIILGKCFLINVWKVLWICEEVGLVYQQEDYGSGFKFLDMFEFQCLNFNSLVLVLLDDDFVFWELNSICCYLVCKVECWDLLFVELQFVVEVEYWMDWQVIEFNIVWCYVFMGLVCKDLCFQDLVVIKESIVVWIYCVCIVEVQLQCIGVWIVGECFILVDIVLGLLVYCWKMIFFVYLEMLVVECWYMVFNQCLVFMCYGNNGVV